MFFVEKTKKSGSLKRVSFFVEATSEEKFHLWKDNKYFTEPKYKHTWKEDLAGFSQVIGYIKNDEDMPVCVEFTFAILDGFRVCFYNATSRFVDHKMIEDFILKNYPVHYNDDCNAMTNATNFHHVALAINEHKENKR